MPLSDAQERLEALGDQLRAKIASKFAASTFLAGFAFTVLAAQASSLWEKQASLPVLFPAALGLIVAATFLFVLGVVRLDELTMPKRFWKSSRDLPRTADDVGLLDIEDLWGLQGLMVHHWQCFTIVGTAATGCGILLLLVPQADAPIDSTKWPAFLSAVGGAILAIGYGLYVTHRASRRFPKLRRPVD